MNKHIFGFSTLVLLLFAMVFVSCDDDTTSELTTSNLEQADAFADNMQARGGHGHRGRGRACFDLVFPVSFEFEDGSTVMYNSKEEARDSLRSYKASNPDAARPELIFPVTIEYRDGTTVDITDAEALEDAQEDCREDNKDRRKKDRKKKHHKKCFTLVYPVTFEFEDGTTATYSSHEEARDSLRSYKAANPDAARPTLVFPVTIQYPDSSTVEIADEEALESAKEDCRGDRDRHERCFTLVYPVTFEFEDGSTATYNSSEEVRAGIRAYKQANPGSARPSLVFPVTVTYEDGSTAVANSREELHALKESCDDDDDD